MAGGQLGHFLCSGLCHQVWKDTGLWNRSPALRTALWKCPCMWPFAGNHLVNGSVSLLQEVAVLWLRKPFIDFIKNNVKQTRRNKLFSLIYHLLSLWGACLCFPSPLHAGFTDSYCCTQLLHGCWGSELGFLCLCHKHSIHGAISLCPANAFFN